MPMLRCAFWLSIVYASILLHPAVSTGRDAAEAVIGAGTVAKGMAAAMATTATLATVCATRADACGNAALDATRGDAAGLATLFASAATDVPAPVPAPSPAPRRHARVRVLTPTLRPCKGGCEPVTDAR